VAIWQLSSSRVCSMAAAQLRTATRRVCECLMMPRRDIWAFAADNLSLIACAQICRAHTAVCSLALHVGCVCELVLFAFPGPLTMAAQPSDEDNIEMWKIKRVRAACCFAVFKAPVSQPRNLPDIYVRCGGAVDQGSARSARQRHFNDFIDHAA
jgi:hypothetical protein